MPFIKIRGTDLSGGLLGDIASGLRPGQASSLPLTVAAVWLQGATNSL